MIFWTRWNHPETIPTEPGTKMMDEYQLSIDPETKKEVLILTGQTNLWEKIQAHEEECRIENILARAAIDPTVLEAKRAEFMDCTDMPKTLMEAQVKIMAVKQEFEKLPPDVRAQFDYSAEKYVSEYGSAEWAKALGLTQEDKQVLEKVQEKVEMKKGEGEVTNDQ